MNKKICSQCEETFDIDEANYRDYFSSPLCNKCYDKGLKPSGWPEHWEWTHSWPRKYDKNNFCMFCEENIPDGLYYCDNCRREIGETSVFTIIGDTMSEDDVNQLKGLCC